ncbi:hypothetical protein BJY00DRAFT_281370 [Aspergillus carlsbadensis]|nr:hypothetical protein BJY00DRAFT_281370 [Aspergillus carlsbadensis]
MLIAPLKKLSVAQFSACCASAAHLQKAVTVASAVCVPLPDRFKSSRVPAVAILSSWGVRSEEMQRLFSTQASSSTPGGNAIRHAARIV